MTVRYCLFSFKMGDFVITDKDDLLFNWILCQRFSEGQKILWTDIYIALDQSRKQLRSTNLTRRTFDPVDLEEISGSIR